MYSKSVASNIMHVQEKTMAGEAVRLKRLQGGNEEKDPILAA